MDDVGMGPYEGSNLTVENATELVEDGQAPTIFAWVVISLFILLNIAAICLLSYFKASKSIYSRHYHPLWKRSLTQCLISVKITRIR